MSLMSKIERFCESGAITPTRFGRLAVNDPRLVRDLRNGRRPGAAMIARIETFMATGNTADIGAGRA